MEAAEAKIISMVSLGIGSFLAGILPAWLSPLSRERCPLFLSCLLCCGGGVLLATSLLHMLPEARETLPLHAELSVCGGFFIIYFVDELVHFLCGESIDKDERNERQHLNEHHGHSHYSQQSQNYGSCDASDFVGQEVRDERLVLGLGDASCHVSHEEPCNRSSAGFIGLLLALLLHSVLEGLAIGLQSVGNKVILLAGAVASHKLVVGFCLGVEISATGSRNICSHIVTIAIFSLGSVVGIGIGMFIQGSDEIQTQSTMGILMSLAAGTLLYVTVSEVLPRERAKWHHSSRKAGLIQLTSTLFGFVLMYLMTRFIGEDQ